MQKSLPRSGKVLSWNAECGMRDAGCGMRNAECGDEGFRKADGMIKDVFTTADILVPEGVPMEEWSVIACDQFSSERDYWERIREKVGGAPSTLHMIIPEAYLDEIDEEKKTGEISAAMDEYLRRGVLRAAKDSFVYVERTQPDGRVRRGLVGAVDLEEYDFSGGPAAILASEGTVLERLPARIRIRRSAGLELPHIMVFIDDKAAAVIEPLSKRADELPLLYDFDLMEGGGHIRGMRVSGDAADAVAAAVRSLHTPEHTPGAHGIPGASERMLMVVGDGNHSLAAAKVYWDELKQGLSDKERENHPARLALVEVINVYDPAISFEAIHRVIFDVDPAEMIYALNNAFAGGSGCDKQDRGEYEKQGGSECDKQGRGEYELRWITSAQSGSVRVSADCIGDMLTALQEFLDRHIKRTGCRVDYIHGADTAERLARQERRLGLILPAMDKDELFKTVAAGRVFPKKSFSVGHAQDKRYYLECRAIRS